MRERISNELRQAVFERDNYTCQYCGRSGDEADLVIEHIIPISKGGTDDIRNLCTACSECNSEKYNRMLTISELRQIADKINSSLEYLLSIATEKPEAEIRSEKITVYLTSTQTEALKAVCVLGGVSSIAERINSLVAADIENNKEAINKFLSLKAKTKIR